jgi:hypothetical protein
MAQEYKPGRIVPQSGVYRITHDPQHADMPHEVTVIKGRRFPTCRHWRGSASSWSTRQSTSMKFRTCTRRRLSALGIDAVTDNPAIPLWLAAHEAAHVVARVQLTAGWNLSDLNRPGCMQSVRVWIEPDGTPRGGCDWGYADVIPWPYQAISWAAGPIAEARVREIDADECLRSSADYDMLTHYAGRGYADLDEAMRQGTRIVEQCWPDITHPHAEAKYRVLPLDDGSFGVEVSIPDTQPTRVSPFPTQSDAKGWIAEHRTRVHSQSAAGIGLKESRWTR